MNRKRGEIVKQELGRCRGLRVVVCAGYFRSFVENKLSNVYYTML